MTDTDPAFHAQVSAQVDELQHLRAENEKLRAANAVAVERAAQAEIKRMHTMAALVEAQATIRALEARKEKP